MFKVDHEVPWLFRGCTCLLVCTEQLCIRIWQGATRWGRTFQVARGYCFCISKHGRTSCRIRQQIPPCIVHTPPLIYLNSTILFIISANMDSFILQKNRKLVSPIYSMTGSRFDKIAFTDEYGRYSINI